MSNPPDDPFTPSDATILRPRPGRRSTARDADAQSSAGSGAGAPAQPGSGRAPLVGGGSGASGPIPADYDPQTGAPYGPAQSPPGYGQQSGAPTPGYGAQPGAPYGNAPAPDYGAQAGAPYGNAPAPGYGSQPSSPYGSAPSPFQPAPPIFQQSAQAPAQNFSLPGLSLGGANALLQAAVPLLVLAGRLRGQIGATDIENLRRQASQEIRSFEERVRQAGISAEDALAARYALCTVIDEAVLNTPWGAQSGWAGQSLLVTFHRESSGGEKFFQILERVMSEPQRYIALIELLYACMSLGFEGRYRLDERGPIRLAEIRNNLYRVIQSVRGPAEADLSPRWKGVEDRRNAVVRLVPLWVVAAACGALLLAAFIVFSARLSSRADGLNATLANIGLEPLFTPVAPIPAAPLVSFKTLLAQQIAAGKVTVDERADGQTSITVTAPDLFASASTTLNPSYSNLMREIGGAAEKVPGQVLVVGHTDDQPLRSLRFQDNFELSRARAVEVANLLKTQIRDPSRVDFAGKGSSEPRFKPESASENRARNRRVEIIHRRIG